MLCWRCTSNPETQCIYYVVINKEVGFWHITIQKAGYLILAEGLCRGSSVSLQSSGKKMWLMPSAHTVNLCIRPLEGLTIPLGLTWRKPCHSPGSEALESLTWACPIKLMSTIHIHSGLHPRPTGSVEPIKGSEKMEESALEEDNGNLALSCLSLSTL